MNNQLPIAVCAIVNDVVSGSHDTLEMLFGNAGAPGEPPDLAHHSKWKVWLKMASDDTDTDAHAVLGKIIEEFMEVEPISANGTIGELFGFNNDSYYEKKERLVNCLEQNGLRYCKGGKVENIPKGFGISNLSEALQKRDFNALEIEFIRALDNVEKDPAAAVTAACSILEALFVAYLEKNLIDLPNKQSIKPLWSLVQKDLGLDPKSQDDLEIKKILSGLSSIIDGIAAFRTHCGSAHGGGELRYKVKSRHAKLTVSSSHTLALFVIETWEEKYKNRNQE